MLLRSVTKHLKEQNWFAVLVDFVIVVFGVFVGLQVQEWNEQRKEFQQQDRYYLSYKLDLESDLSDVQARIVFQQAQRKYLLSVRDNLDLSAEQALISLYLATYYWENPLTDTTVNELIGNGKLYLLGDEGFRKKVAFFYRQYSLNTIPIVNDSYRILIRSIIPVEVQELINSNCNEHVIGHVESVEANFVDCAINLNQWDTKQIMNEIVLRENFKDILSYRLSYLSSEATWARGMEKKMLELDAELDNQRANSQ